MRHVFLEAEPKRGALNSIDLGSARKFAVAEATLWSVFGGVSFAAQVATMVCSEAPAKKFDKKINIIFNETKTMLCRSTALSVRKYLSTSAFSPRPRLGSIPTPPVGTSGNEQRQNSVLRDISCDRL